MLQVHNALSSLIVVLMYEQHAYCSILQSSLKRLATSKVDLEAQQHKDNLQTNKYRLVVLH